MRRVAVWWITFIGGLYFLVEFVCPERAPKWLGGFANPLTPSLGDVTNFLVVVVTMALLLGPFNLVRTHIAAFRRGREGRLESVVFLVFLAAGILITALRGPDDPNARNAFNALYDVLLDGVLTAFFGSSMALLAFYLVSAAHRAFRVSSLDAALMMASAAIVMLGQVPAGDWLTGGLPRGLQLRTWAQWILMVPNTAVQRAVLIGACGGAFATGLRLWLGIGSREQRTSS